MGAAASLPTFEPVAMRIGAEVQGVRLASDLDPAVIDAIRVGLGKFKVLFFRDQMHLDNAEHEGFARRFGDIFEHPTVPARLGEFEMIEFSSKLGQKANSWHSDATFVDAPPMASVLRAITLPDHGGDTMWANMTTAYGDLSAEMRQMVETLWGVHSNVPEIGGAHAFKRRPAKGQAEVNPFPSLASTIFETEHPLISIHPETGEKMIFTGGHNTKGIRGYAAPVARHLLDLLQLAAIRPENTVRWQWRPGDVAMWDNRATQHYAIDDYGDAPRVMRRVSIAGVPLHNVQGESSRTVSRTAAA